VLVTFGDSNLGKIGGVTIGNLDTIFGYRLWPAMDVIYPLATITVFLLFGYVKGNGFRVNVATVLLFVSFLAALALMNIDDIAIVLQLAVYPPKAYWVAISWIYPVYAACAFFLFGKFNAKEFSSKG
jgi:hypothetical protein